MIVTVQDDNFIFTIPVWLNYKAKNCGARFHKSSKTWRCKTTKMAASAIMSNFNEGEYDPIIKTMVVSDLVIPELDIDPNAVLRVVTLADKQMNGIRKAWGSQGFALFWVMGCVSGDTKLQVLLGAGKGRIKTIKEMFDRQSKYPNSRNRCRALKGDSFGQHDIEQVVYSGNKEVYRLILEDGKELKATKNHKILTPNGYVKLEELSPRDVVLTNGIELPVFSPTTGTRVNKPDKDGYIRVRCPSHPRAWKSAKIVYEHILVVENHLGRYLLPGELVHHKDRVRHNNDILNLELKSSHDHLVGHGEDYRKNLDGGISPVSGGEVVVIPKKVAIKSISYVGFEDTYDLVMKNPHHNFVANGIVVHNSGKTLASMALANLRFNYALIDQLLIVCPTSIKGVWKKEYDRYSAIPFDMQVLEAGDKLKRTWAHPFRILVVGIEALSQGGASDVAAEFIRLGKTMIIMDESSRIKNHEAKRTETCCELADATVFRLALTGTNVTQGLHDLYSQMYFINPYAIGEASFYSFRNRYCVMGGFENNKVIGYKEVEGLLDKVRPHCDVIRKKDMTGLPEKSYQIRKVKATPAQVKACKELAKEMKTTLGDKEIKVANALEALLRFQQISGGHMPDGTPLPTNPKLAELVALLADFDGKAIIWARYVPEILAITEALNKEWPGSAVALYGEVAPPDRQPLVDKWSASDVQRFVVSNQSVGGMGLTMIAATLTVYYSNTFSLEERLQSEDRNHRMGQVNNVLYVDLVSDLRVDRLVIGALENKKDLADYVNDNLTVDDLI